jgi:hypothetical protein
MSRGVRGTLVRVTPFERGVSSARWVSTHLPTLAAPVTVVSQGLANAERVCRSCHHAACRALTWVVRQIAVVGNAVARPAGITRGRGRSLSSCVHHRRGPGPLPQAPAGLRPTAAPCRAADRSLQSEVDCELAAAPRLLDRRSRSSAPADVALSGARTTGSAEALIQRGSGRQQPPRPAPRWPPVYEPLGGLPSPDSCAPCPGSLWVP